MVGACPTGEKSAWLPAALKLALLGVGQLSLCLQCCEEGVDSCGCQGSYFHRLLALVAGNPNLQLAMCPTSAALEQETGSGSPHQV